MKTIAVDFDGVIHAYSKGWADGTCYDRPVLGAIGALQRLMKSHAVFVFSTRDARQIKEWFKANAPEMKTVIVPDDAKFFTDYTNSEGDLILGITNRKLAAIAYIDDRAIRFTNWPDVLAYFT